MIDRMVCPKCRREFDPDQSDALPFCSERCRLIDLGAWLEEDYGLPYEEDESPKIFEPEKPKDREEDD